MTHGSEVHDALGRHLRGCAQCRGVDPERARLEQPRAPRHSVPEETMAALCSAGRSLYQAYLRWLAEPG